MVRLPRLLHDETLTVHSAADDGAPDDYGVPGGATTDIEWAGAAVQQIKTAELADHQQERATAHYRVSGPPLPEAVGAGDKISWRGVVYQIEGEPDTRRGLGRIPHSSLTMYRVRG